MRLDTFLKASRIIIRRTAGKAGCEDGNVLLNGVPAKPSHRVQAGDTIEVRHSRQIEIWTVLALPVGKNVSKPEAAKLVNLMERKERDIIE